MKVLFVSRGDLIDGISSIVKNQGDSLIDRGTEVTFFTIKGAGIKGYLKAIPILKKYLKVNSFDIVHAHYSFSAIIASMAGASPLVVSLMGSDLNNNRFFRFFIKVFTKFFWQNIIVKSDAMKKTLGSNKALVIPNGVNFKKFKPIDKLIAAKNLNWNISKKHILFAANPDRLVKNFKLANNALTILADEMIELHYLKNVSHDDMPLYHNASDVVLLTSIAEGSPNVIKEAMACNISIVSTDVGDVSEIIGKTSGCYISNFEPNNVAERLKEALLFKNRTTGRNDIQYLEESIVADKIINIYKCILQI